MASLAIGALAVATTAGTALANPMCDTQTPALGGTVSCEYDLGGSTTITVPPGTIAIDVTLRGGGGGAGGTMSGSEGYSGGSGARVVASLSPSVSASLTVKVGAGGEPKGPLMGGTGGGFSAIYEGASLNPGADSVLAVAGGGGGGGYGTRCADRGTGGEGGLGLEGDGSSGYGDTPGIYGGRPQGSGGSGGILPFPLTGAGGGDGSSWATT